jgi:DNA-binding transcriptional LysR family regulator
MHLEMFKMFCDLVETGSFTRAAEINGVSQSAVSQNLAALEGRAKTPLVQRRKARRCQLTPAGEEVWAHAKEVVRSYDGFQRGLERLDGLLSGSMALVTSDNLGLHELAGPLKRFLAANPLARVRVEFRRGKEVYQALVDGAVDLGLVAEPTEDCKWDVIPVQREQMVLICAPDHPLAKGQRVGTETLAGQKYIRLEAEGSGLGLVERALREDGVVVEDAGEFDSIETVKRAVELGAGVAIVPEVTVRQEVAAGVLARVKLEPFEREERRRVLAVVHRKTKVLSPAMEQLIAVLKEPL